MDLIDLEQAVQELSGKIVVKRRDNEAQQRAQQAAIDKNEVTILRLREKVRVRRRDLAKMLNKDKEVIETALSDPKHRFQQLQCKRYDGDTAKQELNEDLCNEIKRLNHVKYQKECKRKRLADLELKLRDYQMLQEINFEETNQKELRRLKSALDKMIMKRNTAKFVHSTYTKSLGQLTKTRSNVQEEHDQMHKELDRRSSDLIDLKRIQQKLVNERDDARSLVINKANKFANFAQDRILKTTYKKVNKTVDHVPDGLQSRGFENQIMSQLMLKNRRRSMATNVGSLGGVSLEPGPGGDSIKTRIKTTMEKMQAATSTTQPADIALTYKQEMDKYNLLVSNAGDGNEAITQACKKYSETKNELNEIKYEQKLECDQLEREIGLLETKCLEKEQEINFIETESIKQYEQLIQAMESIKVIKEKFEPDKTYDTITSLTSVEAALQSLKSIEQSIQDQVDDIGEPEQPVRRSVCFDQVQDEKAAIINERVWDRNYDDMIMLSPMKRVQFTGENGSKTNLHESKRIDDIDLNFEDADADSAMKNEHFVTRETILAQSKPKGRKSKQK